METPLVGHLRPLRSAQGLLTLVVLLALATGLRAQSNRAKYDLRWFNLGFTAGMNLADVKISYGKLGAGRGIVGQPKNIRIKTVPGINLGMITNLRLGEYFDLRFIPTISLQQRNFDYVFTGTQGDSIVERRLEAAFGQMPLFLKFKSDLYQNVRVYVMAGVQYSYNFISDQRAKANPDLIKIKRGDFSLEFAAGVDLYADRVKLSPEIRYSLGVRDLYSAQFTTWGNAIKDITTSTITLLFNFE